MSHAEPGEVKIFIETLRQICHVSRGVDAETKIKIEDIYGAFPEVKRFMGNIGEDITLTKDEFLLLKEQLEDIIFMAGHLAYTSVVLLKSKFNMENDKTFEEFLENIPSPSKLNN